MCLVVFLKHCKGGCLWMISYTPVYLILLLQWRFLNLYLLLLSPTWHSDASWTSPFRYLGLNIYENERVLFPLRFFLSITQFSLSHKWYHQSGSCSHQKPGSRGLSSFSQLPHPSSNPHHLNSKTHLHSDFFPSLLPRLWSRPLFAAWIIAAAPWLAFLFSLKSFFSLFPTQLQGGSLEMQIRSCHFLAWNS